LWLALGWLGMLAIFASAHFIMGDAGFPGWLALIPVLGAVAGLFYFHPLLFSGLGGSPILGISGIGHFLSSQRHYFPISRLLVGWPQRLLPWQ
jgi:hypothetical protein